MIRSLVVIVWVIAAIAVLDGAYRAPADCLRFDVVPGHVKRTVDGDTFILYAFAVPPEERVRVLSVDAWEMRDSLGRGPAARDFTVRWLAVGTFALETCRRDSFGRYLGVIWRGNDTLAVALIRAGHGIPR